MAHGIVKTAKLYRFFLEGVRLRHSVLLVYNERTFSRPCHHRKEPYMMGSLFGQILPSIATRNPS